MDAIEAIYQEHQKQKYERRRSPTSKAFTLVDKAEQQTLLIQSLQRQKDEELTKIIAQSLRFKNSDAILQKATEQITLLKNADAEKEAEKERLRQEAKAKRQSEPYQIFRAYHEFSAFNKKEVMNPYLHTQLNAEQLKRLYNKVENYNTSKDPLPTLCKRIKPNLLRWLTQQIALAK